MVPKHKGAAAAYFPDRDLLLLPSAQTKVNFGRDSEERALVIHECVHAWCDVSIPSKSGGIWNFAANALATADPMTKLTSEALAYVAMQLFYIYDNLQPGGKVATPYWATEQGIYGEAYRIAVSIWNKPGKIVPTAADQLKDEIMNDPAYDDIMADPSIAAGFDGV